MHGKVLVKGAVCKALDREGCLPRGPPGPPQHGYGPFLWQAKTLPA